MNKQSILLNVKFWVIAVGTSLLASCGLNSPENVFDPIEQFEKETEAIDAYLEANEIEAEVDSVSLIRYVMVEQGSGEMPEDTDDINIDYEGKFLANDQVFDSGENKTFTLSGLIPAWRLMMPQVKEGGTIIFYAQSYYCYGNTNLGSIPANSTLIFEITLNSIKANN